jgi:hypothetical protein
VISMVSTSEQHATEKMLSLTRQTGCEGRKDLLPKNLNGWFWSANREKVQPTNRNPVGWGYNPWSQTGHKKVPQPDNAEFDINQTSESCLSVLNNVYNDGIAWVSWTRDFLLLVRFSDRKLFISPLSILYDFINSAA